MVIPDKMASESVDEEIQPSVHPPPSVNSGASCETNPKLHPFIQGLLDSLPVPDTDWPDAKRKTWLRAAEDIFALLYRDDNLDLTKGI